MHPEPVIVWLRRDLRLADNPALHAAAATGRPVLPVFLHDEMVAAMGAAPRWRLGLGLEHLAARLQALGSRLILRRGPAGAALRGLVAETGAAAVYWNRLYDPALRARDADLKSALRTAGVEVCSFNATLLTEPDRVRTGQGGFYRVYSPFWRALRGRDIAAPVPVPAALRPPADWPVSDALADWRLGAAMHRGAAVVAAHVAVGEDAARERLARFLAGPVGTYRDRRDHPAEAATSRLSENLACGEITARTIWHAGMRVLEQAQGQAAKGAEHFLKELAWREFAWHLAFHSPELTDRNWRPEWDGFPWRGDNPDAEAWRQGRTGVPMVDAAMRELYVTGTMHNRARMIAASYLTKHLLTHWQVGQAWFADCLIDWDPASNAMGWQWVAGSGPDAAPYFRIFNPEAQAARFDPDGAYVRRFVAELAPQPGQEALSWFRAVPAAWGLRPDAPYPAAPIVGLAEGRERALAAHARLRGTRA